MIAVQKIAEIVENISNKEQQEKSKDQNGKRRKKFPQDIQIKSRQE